MPSLVHIVSTSSPSWSRTRAVRAIDQGACTRPPSGERMQTRQSPSSSRVRSTTSVRSSGTSPVARACSSRYWRRFSAAWSSSWCPRTSRDTAAARGDLAELADQPADELTRLQRTRRGVSVPERHLSRLSRRRRDEHPVVGDLLDAPRRGAEEEDLAHLALEHHLLVQLSHPGMGLLPAGEEHAVEPAVGDGAAIHDGDPLGALAGDDRVGHPVPGDAGSELGEVVRGEAAGEEIEHVLEHRPAQLGERRRTAHRGMERVHAPRLDRGHRHDLLGEHVERVPGVPGGLHPSLDHRLGQRRAGNEVAAILGEDDPGARRVDPVAGAADPLHSAGHRRRRLDLDHQI